MAVHGVGRSTLDIDLLTTDASVLESGFWRAKLAPGIQADVRRGAADDPLAGVVRFTAPDESPVDLVVGRLEWQAVIVRQAPRMSLGEVTLPVASAADLILLKLYAGGAQDAWDVVQLLATPGGAGLAAHVYAHLPALPAEASALWGRIREAK